METTSTPFKLWEKVDRLIKKLPEPYRNDPEFTQSVEDHLVRRTIDLVGGMVRVEDIDPMIQGFETNPENTIEVIEEFVNNSPELHSLLETEFTNFESLLLNR